MTTAIGLCGAHRTGKTTLARLVAESNGIAFVETSASAIFKAAGLDPAASLPLVERIAIQEAMLRVFTEHYRAAEKAHDVFITDRTPLDLASYLLADVQQNSTQAINSEASEFAVDYVKRCIDATNRYFSYVFLVQPGIEVVQAEGKARGCPLFMEHLNTLVLGLCVDERLHCRSAMLPRAMTSLEERAKTIHSKVVYTARAFSQERSVSGVSMH
jgi:predicted ATPase